MAGIHRVTVAPWWLWIALTLLAAAAQTARNAMQKGLTTSLGTVGATYVRFLFGLPFAITFLGAVLLVERQPVPAPDARFLGWVVLGGGAQIGATALMLAAMRLRSFVVATAYVKTEAMQVALFALVFLSERLSLTVVIAVVVATAGVLMMSWPGRAAFAGGNGVALFDARAVALGLGAGALFAASAVGFKGAILSLGGESFVVAATFTLVCGLSLQTLAMTAWQAFRDRRVLGAVIRAWRPSLVAGLMGAVASQMWFLAFAIASTAQVRTLGMVEVLFAQAVSRRLFSQHSTRLELAGVALVVCGTILLVNG